MLFKLISLELIISRCDWNKSKYRRGISASVINKNNLLEQNKSIKQASYYASKGKRR
jgi:hypothetical protein